VRERPLSSVADTVGGLLSGPDARVSGVAVDSREVHPGSLFVALRGERVDGHDFLDRAFEAGAAGALVERDPGGKPAVVVDDTESAMRSLAVDERASMKATVIGITGSTGKTSAKDLTAAVLGIRFRVAASPRSFNTEVGVPVTLLNSDVDADVVVCEMGSRGPGHIRALSEVARPSIGVVTNVGPAHLEMFGSLEGVANAKAELVEALPAEGTAVLNADDEVVRTFASRTPARSLLYGTDRDAEVIAEDIQLDDLGHPSFTLRVPDGSERVELAVAGEHMVWNALAAAACGTVLGLTAGECAAGLKEARLSAWRMEVVESSGGYRILNDAYNANPTSMAAALKAAAWMGRNGRCIAVLGHMAELGEFADREHERIGELVARLGVDRLVVVGPLARRIAVGASREGVEPDRITTADTVEEAAAAVGDGVRPGDVVLLKASRVAGLERLAEELA
jgi:UDP-N-acetylmuramoyl-tripeptide--D-alanyl-D-alanine ligase